MSTLHNWQQVYGHKMINAHWWVTAGGLTLEPNEPVKMKYLRPELIFLIGLLSLTLSTAVIIPLFIGTRINHVPSAIALITACGFGIAYCLSVGAAAMNDNRRLRTMYYMATGKQP